MVRGNQETEYATLTPGRTMASSTWCEDAYFRYCIASEEADGIRVSWEIKDLPGSELPVNFAVLKTENFGKEPFIQLTPPGYDSWTFLDTKTKYSGKQKIITYIVKIFTATTTHESAPVYLFAGLQPKKRLLAKAILRRVELSQRHIQNWHGYLLKRKWTGNPCSCVDPDTKQVLDSDCPLCFGTGFEAGYWRAAIKRNILTSSPVSALPLYDINQIAGNVAPAVMRAQIAGLPPINQYDAWVSPTANYRFYITNIQVAAEMEGLPLVYNVELRLAERSDILYSFPVEV